MDQLFNFLFGDISLLYTLVVYIITVIPLYLLAKKADHDYPWFAFVPLLNIVQYAQIAHQTLWLLLLLFIPYVNAIVTLYLTYKFIKAFGRSGIEILLLIIPIVNFVYMYYLALSHHVEYQLGRSR